MHSLNNPVSLALFFLQIILLSDFINTAIFLKDRESTLSRILTINSDLIDFIKLWVSNRHSQ